MPLPQGHQLHAPRCSRARPLSAAWTTRKERWYSLASEIRRVRRPPAGRYGLRVRRAADADRRRAWPGLTCATKARSQPRIRPPPSAARRALCANGSRRRRPRSMSRTGMDASLSREQPTAFADVDSPVKLDRRLQYRRGNGREPSRGADRLQKRQGRRSRGCPSAPPVLR